MFRSRGFIFRKTFFLKINPRVRNMYVKVKVTVKVTPEQAWTGPEGEQRYSSTPSLTSALEGVGWSTPRPGRFTPGNDPVPIVHEVGWVPGPVWTGAENLGFDPRTVQPIAQSLYRLPSRGPFRTHRRHHQFKMKILTFKRCILLVWFV